jgi:hypothetical protein
MVMVAALQVFRCSGVRADKDEPVLSDPNT